MTSPAFFSAAPPMNHHHHNYRIHHLTTRNDSSHLISFRTCTASASASACACASASSSPLRKTRRTISPSPIRASTNSTATVDDPSVASSSATASLYSEEDEAAAAAAAKIGARVRVKGPLKVYHVPKVPELELTGMEGVLKQYVGEWKGKRISANLPYKIAFVADIGGREGVKFVAHLKEDEFEYLEAGAFGFVHKGGGCLRARQSWDCWGRRGSMDDRSLRVDLDSRDYAQLGRGTGREP
ncbi:hypothetical protein RJ640_015487 [Escallonia rubra]|uniref:Ferredoxin thioredoxin reductase alpha chain domain-containing protein n=1 Tax=Escallonia rubra TaxID=112253 RepID=A0AA88USN0_9ASTE|nr:hypothetical protein RJ640_015487 [Escallonia rubra]